MSTVFIVQELRDFKGNPMHDLTPARVYGELKVLIEKNRIGIAVQPLIPHLRAALKNFSDDDYLLPIGDPVAIGIATALAAEANRGRVKMLRWDKQTRDYIKIEVDLRRAFVPNPIEEANVF